MKTTIDISDSLLNETNRVAAPEGITDRTFVDQGLQHAIAQCHRDTTPFKLRPASVLGSGLQPAVRGAGWERLHELACEGRGA